MILPIIIPTQKEEMSKKRICALALALGMLSTQSGTFAKTIADQDFNVAEDVTVNVTLRPVICEGETVDELISFY